MFEVYCYQQNIHVWFVLIFYVEECLLFNNKLDEVN